MVQQVHAPNGEVYEFPDDTPDDVIEKTVKKYQPTNLLSREGLKSIFQGVGPNIAKGILGSQLGGLEEIQKARAISNITAPVSEEDIQLAGNIREKKAAIAAANEAIGEITPSAPSYPLKIASGVIQSAAQTAPGIAMGVASRNLGSIATAPALAQAHEAQYGSTYARSRVPDEEGKAPADVMDAQTNAKVQALVEAGFEVHPMGKLFEEVGKLGVSELIRRYMLREWKTEIPTTIAQKVSEWSTVERDKPFKDFMAELSQDVIDTAVSVPFGAGLGAGQAKVQQRLGQIGQKQPAATPAPVVPPGDIPAPISEGFPTPFIAPTAPVSKQTMDLLAAERANIDPDKITSEQLAEDKAKVVARAQEEKNPLKPEHVADLAEIDLVKSSLDAGDVTASAKVARKGREYQNENDETLRSARPIFLGPEGMDVSGMKLGQVGIQQPGVYTIGVPTADRDETYMRAAHEDFSRWQKEFLPNSVVIISNESLPTGGARGWHFQDSKGRHLIIPSVVRKMKDSKTFNPNAQVSAFFTNTHEFGHAIVKEKFFEEVDPVVAATVRKEAQKGLVSEAMLAELPEAQQAVVREFNSIKERLKTGELTAREFTNEWMGPAKVLARTFVTARGVADNAPASQLINAMFTQAVKENETLTQQELADVRDEYLGLDEYLAEQTARHAYAKQWDQKSAFNKESLFAQAFASGRATLRAFFSRLKKDGDVSANTKFGDWLDSLTRVPVTKVQPGTKKKAAAKKKVAKAAAPKVAKPKVKKEKALPEVQRLDHNTDTESVALERIKVGRGMVAGLVRDGTIEANGEQFKELNRLLKEKDFSTFRDEIQPLLGKKVKFEIDDDFDEVSSKPAVNDSAEAMAKIMAYTAFKQ